MKLACFLAHLSYFASICGEIEGGVTFSALVKHSMLTGGLSSIALRMASFFAVLHMFAISLPKRLDEAGLAEQYVSSRIMDAGVEGILTEDLVEEAAEEGYKPSAIREAVKRLLEKGEIREIGWNRVAASPLIGREENLYTIEVLRVEQGRARILVNGEIEAILQPEDYYGPRNLIRKYVKFRAKAELYISHGIQHARISEVREVLNLDEWMPEGF